MSSFPIAISPSILAADFARLGEQVRDAETAGAHRLHIDVMDGRFVPNITMGALVVEAVRRTTTLPLDVHLMIIEPDHLLPAFAQAGASRIYVHWETCPNLHRTLSAIRALGVQPGVAINPHTPANFLTDILHLIDGIMVMTVNPGFGGQAFLPETLPKIAALRAMVGDRGVSIGVDGGINAETGRRTIAAGADLLVVGSVIFNTSGSVFANMEALRGGLEI
jgi:ribulose-phosphate 3-epimerase